jgi:hypothetical protein
VALRLQQKKRHLSPKGPRIEKERGNLNVMNIFRQLLFITIFIVGLSLTASAQKQGDQKKPPKKDPPQIVAPDKKPKEEKPPKNDNRGKKP